MLISMAVSLFTSRVVLNALGVEDFGINNVVGGFLGMLSFLNASMSGATSRFITFELGRGDSKRLSDTFSSVVIIHAALAMLIVLAAETVGLWFLENKLVIPADRMTAARIIYQLAIFGTALGIMQTPYNAAIISHEKMNIFAYFDILGISLRLAVVYLLMVLSGDKLILLGILYFIVGVIMMTCYRVYCLRNFKETRFHWCFDKNILKPMLSFSGWDLYGNMSVMARTQGVSVLLNMFFGPIINAASGIATQIQGAVMSFSSNVITAYRPQLVKQYATGDTVYMFKLLRDAMKISTLLLVVVTVPLMVELKFVINIWLGSVPDYVVPICRWTLIFNFFATIGILLAAIIHATGRMKRISLINGSLYLLVLPITYLSLKLGSNYPILPFIFNVFAIFIGVLSNAYSIKLYIPSFRLKDFIFKDYFVSLIIFIGTYEIVYFLSGYLEEGWMRLFISILESIAILAVCAFSFYLPKSVKAKITDIVKAKLSLV